MAVKVAILVVFAAAGLWFVKPGNLSPALWPRDGGDPVRRGRAVHRLRRLRARDQRRARHARPEDDAAARALHQRDPGDHHLPRGVGDGDRQSHQCADRAGPGLCAGGSGKAVPRRIRLPPDRDRRAVLDRVGDQRHALRLGQCLLHDRARRRVAGGTVAYGLEGRHRRAVADGGIGHC